MSKLSEEIKQLQKLQSKRIAHRAVSWLQRTEYRLGFKHAAPVPVNPNALYNMLVQYRASEALHIGPRFLAVSGNSRMHGAEPLFETLIPGCVVVAISGDRTEWEEARLDSNVFIYQPKIIVDDIGGNDILGGSDVDTVLANKVRIFNKMKAKADYVWIYDICPVGPALAAARPEINPKIRELNARFAQAVGEDNMLHVAPYLTGPDGNMAPQFNSGDNVHHSPLAYTTPGGYIPTLTGKLLTVGIKVAA